MTEYPFNDERRKLPLGIQSFEKLRGEGFVYIDKTAFVYRLAKAGNPCFLSSPVGSAKACCSLPSKLISKVKKNCSMDSLSNDWKKTGMCTRYSISV